MPSVVYSICHVASGKRYVGSASDRAKRWSRHRLMLRENRHHSPKLQNAYNKYGADAFEWSILEYVEPERLTEREQHWIDHFNSSVQGYNINAIAGSNRGTKRGPMSEETKRKISEAQKGRKMSPEHYANYLANRVNGMEGKKQSDHFKKRMSEVHKGKSISPEQIERCRKTRRENDRKNQLPDPFKTDSGS